MVNRVRKAPGTGADKRADTALGVWIAIGSGVGCAFGVVFDEIALGIGFGACLGVVLGVILPSLGDDRAKPQRHAPRERPGR